MNYNIYITKTGGYYMAAFFDYDAQKLDEELDLPVLQGASTKQCEFGSRERRRLHRCLQKFAEHIRQQLEEHPSDSILLALLEEYTDIFAIDSAGFWIGAGNKYYINATADQLLTDQLKRRINTYAKSYNSNKIPEEGIIVWEEF